MIDVNPYGGDEGEELEEFAPAPPPPRQKNTGQQKPIEPPVAYRPESPRWITRVPNVNKRPRFPFVLATGAFFLAMPGCALGLALCVTIIGIPLGLPIMTLSCLPLHYVLKRHSARVIAWHDRDRPLDEETVKPWETS